MGYKLEGGDQKQLPMKSYLLINKKLTWLFAIGGYATIFLLSACEQEELPQSISYASNGPVTREQQRPGDPEAGYLALVNSEYITCGIPYSAYSQTASVPKQDQLIPGRTGRNKELPYFLNSITGSDGVELISNNCLLCHAAKFNGKLIIGLGNEFLDFTGDGVSRAERVGQYVKTEAEAVQWRKWADRVAAIEAYTTTDTIGVNPAVNMTLALMMHHDPETLAWSEQPLIQPPSEKPLPVSVPPWWRMKKKHAMFYNGEGRGDHARIMMLASIFCINSVAEAEAIDQWAPDIRAYLESLEAPKYPYLVNQKLAKQGAEVFQQNCSTCHGSYGKDEHYPNLLIDYEEVGTDPMLAKNSAGNEGKRFMDWFNQSYYGETARAQPAPGYYAPPLDGIWATAPYLHNGSVPTIEALLNSTTRPRYWLYPEAPTDYDENTLGWHVTDLEYGKPGAKSPKQRKRIYDTTLIGYSNAGHIYGDHLKSADRTAVIEYLKTL